MKKIIYLFTTALFITQNLANHTLLIPRSVSTDATAELSLDFYQDLHKKREHKLSWSITASPFYQASSQSSKIAQYLLPSNSTYLEVREDGRGNVGSPWLYLVAQEGKQFNSILCMNPKFEKWGALFRVNFNLDSIAQGLWCNAVITPLQAINKLNLCETQRSAQGAVPGYRSITQALNNYGTQYWCDKTKKGGLDDIQLKIGYTHKPIKRLTVQEYIVGILPTSPREKAYYFFEPLVGSGGHGGIGFGLSGCADIRNNTTTQWSWLYDAKYWYLFHKNQPRAFDLTNSDWSRYLLGSFQEVPELGFPLLPLLVRCAHVTPGSQLSLWQALHCRHEHWHAELGTCFWFRTQENIDLSDVYFGTLGIYDILGMRLGIATSASTATIDQTSGGQNSIKSDTIFKKLSANDINCCSGAQPKAYTFKLFGSLGYEITEHEFPVIFGVNGFYEFSNSAAALNQWGIFLRSTINF